MKYTEKGNLVPARCGASEVVVDSLWMVDVVPRESILTFVRQKVRQRGVSIRFPDKVGRLCMFSLTINYEETLALQHA